MHKNAAVAAPRQNNEELGPGICPNLQIHQNIFPESARLPIPDHSRLNQEILDFSMWN
jgi:hypothetical protein